MKKLTAYDFKIGGVDPFYYSYKNSQFEICLEQCFNGFDVAIYDEKENLLEPKECTNLSSLELAEPGLLSKRGLEIANKFYKKYAR